MSDTDPDHISEVAASSCELLHEDGADVSYVRANVIYPCLSCLSCFTEINSNYIRANIRDPCLTCFSHFARCLRRQFRVHIDHDTDNTGDDIGDTGSPSDSSSKHGLCGLVNLGSTCYMNSALQCLSSTAPMREYFTEGFEEEMGGALSVAFSGLLKKMWSGEPSSVKPDDLKKLVGSYVSRFSGFSQEDSQEFLTFLLDGLHEDLNRPATGREGQETKVMSDKEKQRLPDKDLADLSWTKYLEYNKSKIVDLFQGQLKTTLTCGNEQCCKMERTFVPFMFLHVPLPDYEVTPLSAYEEDVNGIHPKVCTLNNCLELLKKETPTVANNWFCEGCEMDVELKRKDDIWKLPEILIVHLKRFHTTKTTISKLDIQVDFSFDLDLSQFVSNPDEHQPHYDLFAVIDHQGSIHGGHYTATTKHNGHWYQFNDENIVEKTLQEVKQPHAAYVLFYQRKSSAETRKVNPNVGTDIMVHIDEKPRPPAVLELQEVV